MDNREKIQPRCVECANCRINGDGYTCAAHAGAYVLFPEDNSCSDYKPCGGVM